MIDQNNDVTFSTLRNIIDTYPDVLEYVKTASVGESYRANLPLDSFADKYNRRFPLASKQDAVLSKAYATKVANLAPEIMANIDTALEMYEVPSSIFQKTKVASTAEESKKYLLEEQQKLPIDSNTNIKLAEQQLFYNKAKLKPSTLNKAASVLIKEAYSRGENVSTQTLKYAGLVQSDTEYLTRWIEARAASTNNKAAKSAFDKLASVTKAFDSSVSRDELIKLSNTIEQLDTLGDLTKHYNKSLPDAISTVFNTKIAMQPMVDLGKQVPLTSLLAVDPAVYGDILGSDIVEEISSNGEIVPDALASILETLPKDMKDSLVKELNL